MVTATEDKIETREVMHIYPKVHLYNLMLQAAKECRAFGLTMGFQMAQNYLNKIAGRAIETKDEKILACLYQLGILTSANPEDIKEMEAMVQRTMLEVV